MNLQQEDWIAQLEQDINAVILDVRTEGECNEGIIPKAINIDFHKGQGFVYQIDELDKSKSYYVYCRSGARSEQACHLMNQMGFENTFNLLGGIMQWQGEMVSPE